MKRHATGFSPRRRIVPKLLVTITVVFVVGEAHAAKLHAHTLRAWEQYLQWADEKVARELRGSNGFLIQDYLSPKEKAEVQAELKAGKVVVRKMRGVEPRGARFNIDDGTIHHWWGSIFVPGVALADLLRFVQDYDNHAGKFIEVEKSRLLSKQGETYKFYFRLKRAKAPITVYYNTEQECSYYSYGPKRASSRSVAHKIAELENPGTPQERERTHDDDWGFLWRVVTWWRFVEADGGVIVECESASLSRGVPGWLRFIPGAMGYLESVPRESIENTLGSIRKFAPSWKMQPESRKR